MEIPVLESKRLRFERLGTKHVSDDYVSWMNDVEVTRYLVAGGNYTREALVKYLKEVEEKPTYFWALIRKDNGKHIGNIKIAPVNLKYKKAEYGILIGDRDSWGQGFAKESTERVLEFCFNDLNLNKVSLGVVEKHVRAYELYKKVGFVTEGHFIEHSIHQGEYCNTYVMAIFKRDFQSKASSI